MDINGYRPKYGGFKGRSLVDLKSVSPEEICEILYAARILKRKNAVGEKQFSLAGKQVLLVSKAAYSGMRIAFEIAVRQLGGTPIILPLGGTQLETLVEDRDFLPVIKRYGVNGIAVNTADWRDAELLKEHTDLPVLNSHGTTGPCVALAALMTLWERFGRLKDLNVAVIGNMRAHSFMVQGCMKCGVRVNAVSLKDYAPAEELVASSEIYAPINVFRDIREGVAGVDAVYVAGGDQMGEDYKVTDMIMAKAAQNAVYLQPAPVDRETDADEDVADGGASAVLDLSENYLHVIKAVLALSMGKPIVD